MKDKMKFNDKREELVLMRIVPTVSDEGVIMAMKNVPRHKFVDDELIERAYDDQALSIGYDQTISQPSLVANMTEMLEIAPDDIVLEIGTGSGYQTAILAELAKHVYSIELIPELSKRAEVILEHLGYENVTLLIGDGSKGHKEKAPYDGIIVTAAAKKIPKKLIEQLKIDGKMIIPIGSNWGYQYVYKLIKNEGGTVDKIKGPAVRFVPLVSDEID